MPPTNSFNKGDKMFGAVPGTYRSLVAATMAAAAYEVEEKKEWSVVTKDFGEGIGERFQPCMKEDVKWAEKEGWKERE